MTNPNALLGAIWAAQYAAVDQARLNRGARAGAVKLNGSQRCGCGRTISLNKEKCWTCAEAARKGENTMGDPIIIIPSGS